MEHVLKDFEVGTQANSDRLVSWLVRLFLYEEGTQHLSDHKGKLVMKRKGTHWRH